MLFCKLTRESFTIISIVLLRILYYLIIIFAVRAFCVCAAQWTNGMNKHTCRNMYIRTHTLYLNTPLIHVSARPFVHSVRPLCDTHRQARTATSVLRYHTIFISAKRFIVNDSLSVHKIGPNTERIAPSTYRVCIDTFNECIFLEAALVINKRLLHNFGKNVGQIDAL